MTVKTSMLTKGAGGTISIFRETPPDGQMLETKVGCEDEEES